MILQGQPTLVITIGMTMTPTITSRIIMMQQIFFWLFLCYCFPLSNFSSPLVTWLWAPSNAASIVSNFSPCSLTRSERSSIILKHSLMFYIYFDLLFLAWARHCIYRLCPRQHFKVKLSMSQVTSPLTFVLLSAVGGWVLTSLYHSSFVLGSWWPDAAKSISSHQIFVLLWLWVP